MSDTENTVREITNKYLEKYRYILIYAICLISSVPTPVLISS